jgi:hypothetical protein
MEYRSKNACSLQVSELIFELLDELKEEEINKCRSLYLN